MKDTLIDVQHKAYEQGRKQGEQEARQHVLDEVRAIAEDITEGMVDWKEAPIGMVLEQLKHTEERDG